VSDARFSPPWLPLLQELSGDFRTWAVWKNADSGLAGLGDIDSLSPRRYWPAIAQCHAEWAFAHDASIVIRCPHVPGVLLTATIFPGVDQMAQFDIWGDCFFRGSRIFTATDLVPLMIDDPRGFRRLRPGAEGLFLLVLNGIQRGGRPNESAIRDKRIPELLRADAEGVLQAAQLFGRLKDPIVRAAGAAERGSWDLGAVRRAELGFAVRSFFAPGILSRRLLFRVGALRHCPIVTGLLQERRVPEDLDAWLEIVARRHQIIR
jgi:hypothetical protein